MAAVPAIVAAETASTIISGIGDYKSYRSAASEDEYRARIADLNAANTERQTTVAVGQQQRRAGEVLGEQRAAIAQSGFGATGTMTDIARQSGAESALDAMNIRLHALATWHDILAVARADACFGTRELNELETFLADPVRWSYDHGGISSVQIDTKGIL